MTLFIFSGLSLLLAAFLIMISVQLIRMEKAVIELSELAESYLKALFGKN